MGRRGRRRRRRVGSLLCPKTKFQKGLIACIFQPDIQPLGFSKLPERIY
jgi:hypothetical protein